MSWYFYTSFQRSISAHMHTNLELYIYIYIPFEAVSVDLQIRGARLCNICHPHSQGVLLTHFGSCLKAVDSESQIRCHDISTRVSWDQSQPTCTQTWNVFFGIVHVTTCPEIPFEAVSICKSEGHVCVHAIHTLRACYLRFLVAA